MKATAPWIIAILLLSLTPLETFGRVANRLPAGGGEAARNPVTNSRVSRPAQQPAIQRPAQQPAIQRPAQQPAIQRPAQRPSVQRPAQRPPVQRPANPPAVQRPAQRPANPPSVQRPAQLPAQRPAARPVERPGNRPVARPETLPSRPENRPVIRPNERPATIPGNVTFPRPENRPVTRPDVSRPGVTRPGGGTTFPGITRPGGAVPLPEGITRPGGGINRPDISRPEINRPGGIVRPDNTIPNINRPGVNRPEINRPGGGLNRPGGVNRPDFNINNRPNFSNNNININNNMWNSPSWNNRPNHWGNRPWWGTHHHHHHWHHGSWCHGWSNNCRRRGFVNGFVWGVAAWSMGNWIFNSGCQHFHNPFPAPPVINSGGTTIINYTRPITVAAAELPPLDEAAEQAASEKSQIALEEARAAFKTGDFKTALTAVDTAISYIPGDPVLHEFRALVFFAMGRFNDAAGVLNPILASGPGWDWTTMTGLFKSQDDYTKLLRKLENHHKANPDSAAANFLLGYHYMVLGHLEQALGLFEHAAKLEPTDIVSAGLRDLLRDSVNTGVEPAEELPPPVPVNPDKLVGTWTSKVADDGSITLVMTKEGDFTWAFDKTGNNGKLAGEFGIYDSNLLVLMSEDSQMIGEVKFEDDTKLSFVLAGGPRGDPGLTFVRKP